MKTITNDKNVKNEKETIPTLNDSFLKGNHGMVKKKIKTTINKSKTLSIITVPNASDVLILVDLETE